VISSVCTCRGLLALLSARARRRGAWYGEGRAADWGGGGALAGGDTTARAPPARQGHEEAGTGRPQEARWRWSRPPAAHAGTAGAGWLAPKGCVPDRTERAGAQPVSRAFSSWNRSILTEIYPCHACSDHEFEDGNARAGTGPSATGSPPRSCGGGPTRPPPATGTRRRAGCSSFGGCRPPLRSGTSSTIATLTAFASLRRFIDSDRLG
jgi:hypothetical protein